MQVRKFVWFLGMFLFMLGVLALIPALFTSATTGLPSLEVNLSYGLFLGFIPMNIVNKLFLILFGAAGMLAAKSKDAVRLSVLYCQVMCVGTALLAVLGLIPATQTLGGFWPIFGVNGAICLIVASLTGYFALNQRRGRVADVHHHQPRKAA